MANPVSVDEVCGSWGGCCAGHPFPPAWEQLCSAGIFQGFGLDSSVGLCWILQLGCEDAHLHVNVLFQDVPACVD